MSENPKYLSELFHYPDYQNRTWRLNQIIKKPSNIVSLPNPTEEEQLIAVGQRPQCIVYIENPTEKVQLKAVCAKGYQSLKFIKNPSREVIENSLYYNPETIECVDNPDEELQKIAVSQSYSAIQYINNPTEEVQRICVRQNLCGILCITDPFETVQLEGLKLWWGEHYYTHIMGLGEKSEWLQKEINRLKIEKGGF